MAESEFAAPRRQRASMLYAGCDVSVLLTEKSVEDNNVPKQSTINEKSPSSDPPSDSPVKY
jgi:hypothetical protein